MLGHNFYEHSDERRERVRERGHHFPQMGRCGRDRCGWCRCGCEAHKEGTSVGSGTRVSGCDTCGQPQVWGERR